MQIAEIHSRLAAFANTMETDFFSLDMSVLQQVEAPGKWSLLQVMEHLILANKSYVAQLKAHLEKEAEVENQLKEVKMTIFGKMFLWFVTDKIPFKVPAPGIFKPKKGTDNQTTLEQFKQIQADLVSISSHIQAYDFNRLKIHSPLSRMLVFRVGELLHIIATHQERHLIQMKRILSTVNK